MNNALISLLVAVGIGTWVYTKMMKASGGLTRNALIVAAVSGVFLFLVLLGVLSLL